MSDIKSIRMATGMTQAAFAARFLLPRRTLQNWELGTATPPDWVIAWIGYLVSSGADFAEPVQTPRKRP